MATKIVLERYEQHMDALRARRRVAELRGLRDALGQVGENMKNSQAAADYAVLTTAGLGDQYLAGRISEAAGGLSPEQDKILTGWMESTAHAKPDPKGQVAKIVAGFQEHQRQRRSEHRIGENRLGQLTASTDAFADWCGDRRFTDEEDGSNERLLSDYRAHLLSRSFAPATFNTHARAMKQFVKWAYSEYQIRHLPRNIDNVFRLIPEEAKPNPLSVTEVRKLWRLAKPQMRAWMAVALNGGYYGIDISVLEESHIKGDFAIKPRAKTAVAVKHKLWGVTKRLIKETANNHQKLTFKRHRRDKPPVDYTPLFITRRRRPLIHENRSDAIGQQFYNLRKKVGIKGKSFSSLRDTSTTLIEGMIKKGEATIDDKNNFLAHKDGSMAARYTGDIDLVHPDSIDSTRLDQIIDKLEAIYELKHGENEDSNSTAGAA
ncbi:hypothetical protein ACERK3_01525 [Phycisphaerales bacterium AB-hyl4]|uniref:Core-binding (CB) domain-containing protein n=1 Tax=Natronomicrosphaera hydrolytica TaxID=3242702 RepID=A0ABV4U3T2_9BACT